RSIAISTLASLGTTWMVTMVPITASVRTGTSSLLLGLAQGFDHGAIEGIGTLGSAGDVIDVGTLALGDLRGQHVDHGTRIARPALRDGRGRDAPAFDHDGRLNIAVARI